MYTPTYVDQPQIKSKHRQRKRAVPLKAVRADVKIVDFSAQVTQTQTFVNVEENPIEAVYNFPLNQNYCVTDFTCEVDGKVLKGECQEKQQAKDTYDDAIAEGHGAYLLEEKKADVLSVSVGNLPPKKRSPSRHHLRLRTRTARGQDALCYGIVCRSR